MTRSQILQLAALFIMGVSLIIIFFGQNPDKPLSVSEALTLMSIGLFIAAAALR